VPAADVQGTRHVHRRGKNRGKAAVRTRDGQSITEGAFAKTPWPGNLKMTKLNKIRSPHVATTTHLLVEPPRHPPLSTHAVH